MTDIFPSNVISPLRQSMLYLYEWFNREAKREVQISHHHIANGCTSLLTMALKHEHWYRNMLHPSDMHFVLVQAQNTHISSNLCWGLGCSLSEKILRCTVAVVCLICKVR